MQENGMPIYSSLCDRKPYLYLWYHYNNMYVTILVSWKMDSFWSSKTQQYRTCLKIHDIDRHAVNKANFTIIFDLQSILIRCSWNNPYENFHTTAPRKMYQKIQKAVVVWKWNLILFDWLLRLCHWANLFRSSTSKIAIHRHRGPHFLQVTAVSFILL